MVHEGVVHAAVGPEAEPQEDMERDRAASVGEIEGGVEAVKRDAGPQAGLGLLEERHRPDVAGREGLDERAGGREAAGPLRLVQQLVAIAVDALGASVEDVPLAEPPG